MTEAAATAQAEGSKTSQAGTGKGRGKNTAPKNNSKGARKPMSDSHKANLAKGREEGRIVTEYLDAIDAHKPKRGRRVTRETMEARLKTLIEQTIPQATGAKRLEAIKDRIDLENALSQTEDTNQIDELQKKFVEVAKSYADRKGYTAEVFREAGVPASVLKEAGVGRKSA